MGYAGREQEIAAREKAAASGPWENVRPGGVPPGIICDIDGESWDITGEGDFIAHAREDIPYLLAQLKEARKKLAAVRLAAIKTHSDGWTDCMLCGTTWRTDVEQEYHTDCPLDTKGAE